MTRPAQLHRPAGLALCLIILSVTSGCAHFHDAEVRAQERADNRQTAPMMAATVSQPAPIAPPAPAPPAVEAPPVAIAREISPAEPTRAPAPAPSVREPAARAPRAAVAPAPALTPAPAPTTAPATDAAIIIYANIPGANCGTCETLKLSIAPSGQILVERGFWTAGHGSWRYSRSRAQVAPALVAAFAASMSGSRPAGDQALASCAIRDAAFDGVSIEWIEAERHDRLQFAFTCPAGSRSDLAERLRHAPDLLGLPKLVFPWNILIKTQAQ